MKHIALTLLLSGCATVPYWKHNPANPVFEDADIYFVQVLSADFFDHCGKYPQHADACAVRCVVVNQDHREPACRVGNRWRCVIVSTYTMEQLELMRDRNGMPLDQHEIRHCKGEDHGY